MKTKIYILSLGLVLCNLLVAQQDCSASTATTTFNVTANVTAACSVVATPLTFGAFSPFGPDVMASNSITVTCSNGTAWSAGLSTGSGTFVNRQMTSATAPGTPLNYNIYTANTYATVWGDGTGATQTINDTGTGLAQVKTAYGRIIGPQATTHPANDYTDTITVTVTF